MFLAIHIRITNAGRRPYRYDQAAFTLQDTTGAIYQAERTAIKGFHQLRKGTLKPRQGVTGDLLQRAR